MKPEERERIEQLADWMATNRRLLNELTEHMNKLAAGPVIVSQTTWDRLFEAQRNLSNATIAVANELEEAAKNAGVPVS